MKRFQLMASMMVAVSLLAGCSAGDEKENPNIHPERPEPIVEKPFPELIINTAGKEDIKSKDIWLEGASISYKDIEGNAINYGKTSVKGRGNSTWGYPKKPYTVKLDEKTEFIGLPKEKRFNLLADYIDRTHLRNSVSFEIARKAKALDWTPAGNYVNLTLNGKKMGLYYLCEHIKVAKNRVNLKDGGYILELDTYYDEDFKFRSKILNLPIQLKDPDPEDFSETDLASIEEYFNAAEDSVVNGGNWRELIDEDSFADWWIVLELTQCGEPAHPKSCYMHRDKDGKLKAGPVWDFDWGTFRSGGEVTAFRCKKAIWYEYLFKDKDFVAKVKERWNTTKGSYLSVEKFIHETALYIENAVAEDDRMWPMTTETNKDEKLSFDAAVSTLKSNFKKHWEWMDEQINAM